MKWLRMQLLKAGAAAETLTGKRFGLLVASSVVATTAILAAAMTGTGGNGALAAALLGREAPAPVAATAPSELPEESEAEGPEASPEAAPEAAEFSSAPEAEAEPEAPPVEEEDTPALPETPAPEAGRIKHVFVVSLASPGYEAAFGESAQMPYLASTLRPKGVLLSGYSVLDQAALPNSIAAISGQPPNAMTKSDCPTYDEFPATAKVDAKGVVAGSGCVFPVSTLTVADQFASGQFSWHAYLEGMADASGKPDNCVRPEPGAAETAVTGGYSVRLNPFAFFHSLLDLGDCSTNDVPATELEKDLKKPAATANYSYVAPNLCNAGVAGQCPPGSPDGAAAADAYLAQVVPKILASPAYKKDGLLIVTFGSVSPPPAADPADPNAVPAPAPAEPLKVGSLLVSRFAKPNATDATAYDPYSLLRSTEDLFGLPHLGAAGAAKVKSFAPALLGENGGD
jgi:phosphatidylinositol-3-phosphatase